MPNSRKINRLSAIMHIVGWVGRLSHAQTGIQPEGATQAVLSDYTRYSVPSVSRYLKDAEIMGMVKVVKDTHDECWHSPKHYVLTDYGLSMCEANADMLEKIDRDIEIAWLADVRKDA